MIGQMRKKIFPFNLPEIIFYFILFIITSLFWGIAILSLLPPSVFIQPETLNFGAVRGGPETGDQVVSIEFKNKWTGGRADLDWSIYSKESWLKINPRKGKGRGLINIGLRKIGVELKSSSGKILVYIPGHSGRQKMIKVNLRVYQPGKTLPPFGNVDFPSGEEKINFQSFWIGGWALDDIEVEKVEIKREPFPEEKSYVLEKKGLISLGQAAFFKGIRPDVEKLYPETPFNYRAGWGFWFEPHKLRVKPNVVLKIYVHFQDREKNQKVFGPISLLLESEK